MIKGVSKQGLEVTNPENPYFEKIVFFVKPQYAREDRAVLEREAHSLAARAGRPPECAVPGERSGTLPCVVCSVPWPGWRCPF